MGATPANTPDRRGASPAGRPDGSTGAGDGQEGGDLAALADRRRPTAGRVEFRLYRCRTIPACSGGLRELFAYAVPVLGSVPDVVRNKALAVGADGWLRDLPSLVGSLARQWSITVGEAYTDATEGLVARACLADGTPAVLKV